MEFDKVVHERRSVRHFKQDPVAKEDIDAILEAGIRAPSAGNIQPWRFVVVQTPEARTRLAESLGQRWAAAAPVVIVVAVDPRPCKARYSERGTMLYSIQDSAAATQNMLLAAVNCGLASCWIGAFDNDAVAQAVGLTSPLTPVAVLPIGYSAQGSGRQARRPISEVTAWI